MADPKSVLVAKAIHAALEKITKANGYFTDLGKSIHRGFYAHQISGSQAKFPLASIQPGTESFKSPGTRGGKIGMTLNIYLVEKGDDTDSLQSCVADVRRALSLAEEDINVHSLNQSLVYQTAEYNPQPDSNFQLAALPVSISFMEKYEESP